MKLVLFLCFVAILITPVHSIGTLKVKLKSFSRLSGTLSDGSCCDFNGCSCDPYFTFCWRGYLTSVNSPECSEGYFSTNFYDESNVVNFASGTTGGISNPLTRSVNNGFTGRMQLFINVYDYDPLFGNDYIDTIVADFTVTSLNSLSSSLTYTGVHGSSFTIGRTLTCSTNHYGSLCATFCSGQNSDALGHYTCNPADGSFVCRNGYTGSECKTPICTEGCLNGDCTTPFTCDCDNGWTGSTCSECIPETNCDPMGGFCDGPFNCNCHSGYEGTNCENDTEFCVHNPQVCNNGVCTTTGINAYMCTCSAGYTGVNCQTGINLCEPDPCVNGTCVNHMTDYDCDCFTGYEGKNCTMVTNNCLTSNCSFGTCVNSIGSFSCNCSDGFTGQYCDIEVNECDADPCVNGDCLDFVNGYVCNCTGTGYEGRDCSIDAGSVANPDYCSAQYNYCLNGATCTPTGSADPILCTCEDGFTGTYCGDNTDNCPTNSSLNPCFKGGVCVDLPGDSFQCMCGDTGFQGTTCTEDINECDLSPCNNGGVCQNLAGTFECNCTVGYEGETCLDRTDYCGMGNQCDNEALCVNNRFNYTCQCVLGFRGEFCSEDIDDCVGVFCGNGTCDDGVNGFTCECIPGYTGIECDSELDECVTELSTVTAQHPGSSSVCGVFGQCIDVLNDFECTCSGRYTGDLCRDAIPCASNPCNTTNIVECVGGVTDTYVCVCLPGFTGPQCEIDIDECAAFPCHNSAPCIDARNDYVCDCIPPWKGKNCRYQNTSCLPNPCNNGVCLDVNLTASTYNCTCPMGTTGSNCQLDLDECAIGNHSCPDGINCTNTQGSYVCECDNEASGFDPLSCATISTFNGGLDNTELIYYIILPVICFVVVALVVVSILLFVCCCCIARRHNAKKQTTQAEYYQSLEVNNNYAEIANALPHDEAVTNNPAYATTGGIDISKPSGVTAVTSNPLYAGIQAEENVYQTDFSASIPEQQTVNKSVYNDFNELPVASDFKGVYHEMALLPEAVTSLTNDASGVEDNEYSNM